MPLSVDDLYHLIGIKEAQLLEANKQIAILKQDLQKVREELEKLKSKAKSNKKSSPIEMD